MSYLDDEKQMALWVNRQTEECKYSALKNMIL